jgi:hypothetical protein
MGARAVVARSVPSVLPQPFDQPGPEAASSSPVTVCGGGRDVRMSRGGDLTPLVLVLAPTRELAVQVRRPGL